MKTPREWQAIINATPSALPFVHTNDMAKITLEEVRVKDQAVADAVNANNPQTQLFDRLCTDRLILGEVRNAAGVVDPAYANAILDKLDAIASASSMVKRAMNRVYGTGLDIGSPATQAQLNALVGSAGLTQAEADALIALGYQPLPLTASQASTAIRGPWGDE